MSNYQRRPESYLNNPYFAKAFRKLIDQRLPSRNVAGQDHNRAQQAVAGAAGHNNTRAVPSPSPNPTAAAMQHTVRNRSGEQGSNTPVMTPTQAAGRTSRTTAALRAVIDEDS